MTWISKFRSVCIFDLVFGVFSFDVLSQAVKATLVFLAWPEDISWF